MIEQIEKLSKKAIQERKNREACSLFLLRVRVSVKQWETLVSVSCFTTFAHPKDLLGPRRSKKVLAASVLTRKIVKVGYLVARRRVVFVSDWQPFSDWRPF